MVPFGGGAPAGHGAPPPPPPPPPPASSSSTLSPLAPPFTAWAPPSSRRFAADPDQNPPHPWSSPSPSPSAPAAAPARWSVFDAPGASYYPRYSPSVGGMSADAVFQPLHQPEGHGGLGTGKWGAPFDSGDARQADGSDGVSSWMEPSYDYKAPCFQEGIWHGKHVSSFTRKTDFGPEWLNDRIPVIYEENAISPYNISGESVLTPSALPKGMSSQLPGFNSKFSSTSSYDGYMGYPPKTCSTSAQVHASSSRRTDSSADSSMLTNGYSMVQPVDSYRIRADHENHISTNPKKLDNQNADVKVDYGEMTWANYVKTQTNIAVDPFSLKTGLRSGDELANGNSIDSSADVESGLKLKPLNLPSAYTSECGSAGINDSVGDSSQTLDQLNLAVDSPCWKGAPVPNQSPFGAAETAHLHAVLKECKHSDELDQGQMILPLNFANSVTVFPSAHVGTLICDGKKKAASVSSLVESPVVILPSIQQNLDEASKAKDDNKKGIHSSDSCKEQSNGVRKHQNQDSEALDNEVMQLGSKEAAVYASECITGDGVVNLEMGIKAKVRGHSSDVNPGKPSSSGNDIQLLVQTLYSLSEVLLSSYYYDTKELKEHDHKLLKLVIHNLEAFTNRNKKVMACGRFQDSGVEAAGFWDTGLKADAVTNLVNNKNADDMKGKLLSTESSINNVIKGSITEFSKVNDLAQTFEKVLVKTLFEPEESPQAQVYKNLWIEAEAALCSLKYESQLTRMKIDMENCKHQITDFSGRSPQMAGSSSLNSIHDLDGSDTPMKPKENSNANTMPHLGGTGTSSYRKPHEIPPRSNANRKEEIEIDSSILARLKVLKGRRIEESDLISVEPQMLLGSVDFGPYNEVNDPIYRSEGGSEAGSEHLPAKLADLGFMESIPLTNTNEDTRNKGKIKAGFQFPTTRESHGTTVRMSATIKPYTPTGQRKRLLAGEHSSPPSEWEHVLKEDFTWQQPMV